VKSLELHLFCQYFLKSSLVITKRVLQIKEDAGFEVLKAVVMEISISWDITPCSPLEVNWRFGGACRLHLPSRRIRRARNKLEGGGK
jgi:hypothetical protein